MDTIPTGQSADDFNQMLLGGAHQEGEIKIRHVKVIEYTPGGNVDDVPAGIDGYDRAILEVCYDASAVRYVGSDGTQLAVGHAAFVSTVTMDNQPQPDGSDWWSIRSSSDDWNRSC